MWKYIDKEQCKEFLLSLDLINNNISDKDKIKKLYAISNNIENHYSKILIKKKNGKIRILYEPSSSLKEIQRQILNNILNNKKISKYAKAYHKGISLKDNASTHVNKKIILKLDIKDFFDNISFHQIYNACFSIEYFPKSIGMLLTNLCTYNNHLPQGSPSSSYISNLVMKDFDDEISFFIKDFNISYTRYSDDLTFSGDFDPKVIIDKVKSLLSQMSFKLNYKKIKIINNNQRQLVTGIVVNEKLNIEKKYKKEIRKEMYYLKKYGIDSHLKHINSSFNKEKYLLNLYGRIQFVLQVNDNEEFKSYRDYLKELIKK